jgi:hypothetical protein
MKEGLSWHLASRGKGVTEYYNGMNDCCGVSRNETMKINLTLYVTKTTPDILFICNDL